MPYFAVPLFAIAGLLAAGAVVLAHLISSRTRAPQPLPTLRFIQRAQQRSAAVERRPRDLALLLLRAGALLAAGIALAGPVMPPADGDDVPIVVADFTNAASADEVKDSALAVAGERGVIVANLDSAASMSGSAARSLDPSGASAGGSMTAALVQALREAAAQAARGNRARLTIASAFTHQSFDSATHAVRALWPGSVRLLRLAADTITAGEPAIELRTDAADPLRAGVDLLPRDGATRVLIVRDSLTAGDTASVADGAVLVHWPRAGVAAAFAPLPRPDTASGIWLGDFSWIAPLTRDARLRPGVQVHRVPARWLDGTPAAVERRIGDGCLREVAVGVPDVGDLVISAGLRRLLHTLAAPCGGYRDVSPASERELRQLAGAGPEAATIRSAGIAPTDSLIGRVLLALALLAIGGELVLRRVR